jgi:uncharacterized protein with von Willebrand factor type A (vWA) domain
MSTENNTVQERTNGTCITAFRSGDAIAAIMCRLSKKNKPYLAWYPLTAYRYRPADEEQVSRFIFAEHGQDIEVVTALATEFLKEWKHKALEAIEHVKAEESAQESVEQWMQELCEEREAMAQELKAIKAAASNSRANAVVYNLPG